MNLCRVLFVGHIDHGKSTLVGRLRKEHGCSSDDFERLGLATLVDSFKREQELERTITLARISIRTKKRPYLLYDAPGHAEYLPSLVSGVTQADVAVCVIDILEGMQENTRRHLNVLSFLGVKNIIVAVNKMDAVNYSRVAYEDLIGECSKFFNEIGLSVYRFIPVSGLCGDNVTVPSTQMVWTGTVHSNSTLMGMLDDLTFDEPPDDLRYSFLWVQDIYPDDSGRSLLVGQLNGQSLQQGDDVFLLPDGGRQKIVRFVSFPEAHKALAVHGESIAFEVSGKGAKRGDLMVAPCGAAPRTTIRTKARALWLDSESLKINQRVGFRMGTRRTIARIVAINNAIDLSTLSPNKDASQVRQNEIADFELLFDEPVIIANDLVPSLSRFVLLDWNRIAGAGAITNSREVSV